MLCNTLANAVIYHLPGGRLLGCVPVTEAGGFGKALWQLGINMNEGLYGGGDIEPRVYTTTRRFISADMRDMLDAADNFSISVYYANMTCTEMVVREAFCVMRTLR